MSDHTMHRVGPTADGAEEWQCPDCGRRVALRWDGALHVVLDAGDEVANHVSATPLVVEVLGFEAELVAAQADELFGEPEVTDGLGLWMKLLDRLSREGAR